MKICIINGPNLNLLGTREPEIYGTETFETYYEQMKAEFSGHEIHYFQSNDEGGLIDKLHEVGFDFDGIIFNPGGYAHTSVSVADAIAAIETPVVEVHISNVHARESFRQRLLTGGRAAAVISGAGLYGYEMALGYLLQKILKKAKK